MKTLLTLMLLIIGTMIMAQELKFEPKFVKIVVIHFTAPFTDEVIKTIKECNWADLKKMCDRAKIAAEKSHTEFYEVEIIYTPQVTCHITLEELKQIIYK